MNTTTIHVALDIGSRIVKAAAFDARRNILRKVCCPVKGEIRTCLRNVLALLRPLNQDGKCVLNAVTGENAAHCAQLFGLEPINGVYATFLGGTKIFPSARSILEIGGEHAKFIRLTDESSGNRTLKDFFVNSVCSAGTGSFLEQEAHRLGLTIEDFGRLAAQSTQSRRVAGRCAVFAKTDVVHLQQSGVPLPDIAYSLCRSITQNVCNELVLSRNFELPLVLVGGVAANEGVRLALRDILKLKANSLVVPEDHLFTGVIGSYLLSEQAEIKFSCTFEDAVERLEQRPDKIREAMPRLEPLNALKPQSSVSSPKSWASRAIAASDHPSIGIDIGSTSTNVACITQVGEVAESLTLPTQGKALVSVFRGLNLLRDKLGDFQPRAVGITGSGRKFVAQIIGADAVLNEITAHAIGGRHFFEGADTIFDIGGQDSKYIQIENGSVLNFAMNKVCSAGTGSFLEEMSELLGLKIRDEFAEAAMRSRRPLDLGERCTVFMATELVRKLQEGERKEDLAAGLGHAVVRNYLSRVVGRNKVGKHISFQGGVASNPAIVSALGHALQRPIHVHDNHEIAGAVGAALFAAKKSTGRSKFRGFAKLDVQSVRTQKFECQECANSCPIHFTEESSGKQYFWGGLCDRYDERSSSPGRMAEKTDDPFEERENLLRQYIHESNVASNRKALGIPRALLFYDLIPFWATFFNHLGINYGISAPTSRETVHKGISLCPTNPCLPLKTAYGHCLELRDAGFKRIFAPSIASLSFLTIEERLNHICPASQAFPFTVKSLIADDIDFLTPTIRFAMPHLLKSDIIRFGKSLGCSEKRILQAFTEAMDAQNEFYSLNKGLGRSLFSQRKDGKIYALILARSYTASDPQVRLRLKKIFDELGIVPVPLDMVDSAPHKYEELDGMYWYYGKRFLQAIGSLDNLSPLVVIHLSNFGCGADSFLLHFLRERLKNVPFLELEIDEHNEFTGIGTRVEAFVDSLTNWIPKKADRIRSVPQFEYSSIKRRKLLIPQMSDHAFAFQSSFRAFGVEAEVLPLPDEESIACGKEAVAGGECLPCPFVIGDMLKYLKSRRDDERLPAFFMISGDGPCRLGQYPYLQRRILDERGYEDIFVFDASQDQSFYDRFGILPTQFKRKTWQGVVAIDLLFRKMRECRPYVEEKAVFDGVYYEEVDKICECLESGEKLSSQLTRSFRRFESMIKSSNTRPVVAVLGENYVRCNSVSNGRIAELLEDMGAEVWFPSLFEWVYYGNWTARLHCLYEKKYKKLFNLFLVDLVQRRDEHKLGRAVRGLLRNLDEPSVSKNFQRSSEYVPKTFEGETIIEIARTIDFHDKGVCGVIHAVPFGCIMGNIVETLTERVAKDLNGFPIMTLQYDGHDYKSQVSKLDGFMLRARMWQRKREKT